MKRLIQFTAYFSLFAVCLLFCESSCWAGVSYDDPAGGWRYTYDGTFADAASGVVDNGCISGTCPDGFGGKFSGDADFDEDNDVDGRDFLIWQKNYGTQGISNPYTPVTQVKGNANNDLIIDGLDMEAWQKQYGNNDVAAWNANDLILGPNNKQVGALDGTWSHDQGDKWDGTAPGDPLSDPTMSANPPISLTGKQGTSPGGAGPFVDGDTTYLRVQDAGNPESRGWIQGLTDPALTYPTPPAGAPGNPNNPINTNRRVYFGHDMTSDVPTGDPPMDELVLTNTGLTVSFRVRIPNSGPLDDLYLETDGDDPDTLTDVIPWLQDAPNGRGAIMTNGRGILNFSQNSPTNDDTQVGFSLVTSTDVSEFCEVATGALCNGSGSGGLIMNNLDGNTPSNLIDSEGNGTLNMLEMTDNQLNEWNEFWITMENNGGLPGNIQVKVYMNGSLTPSTFQVTLAAPNNSVYAGEDNPFLEFGSSANTEWGSFDLDFLSYKLGIHAPPGALTAFSTIPEPSAMVLGLLATIACVLPRRR